MMGPNGDHSTDTISQNDAKNVEKNCERSRHHEAQKTCSIFLENGQNF